MYRPHFHTSCTFALVDTETKVHKNEVGLSKESWKIKALKDSALDTEVVNTTLDR